MAVGAMNAEAMLSSEGIRPACPTRRRLSVVLDHHVLGGKEPTRAIPCLRDQTDQLVQTSARDPVCAAVLVQEVDERRLGPGSLILERSLVPRPNKFDGRVTAHCASEHTSEQNVRSA